MATQANLDYVQKMFVAYLGRAASASAQEYYADLIDADATLGKAQLFDDLYNSAEAQALYAGKTDDQVITMIFQNCFNRDPAFAGLTYYYDEIQKGTFNILQAAAIIADGADAEGAAILAAKQTAADKITTEIGSDAAALASYTSNSDQARASLNKVTDTASATAYDAAAELAAIGTGNQIGTSVTLTTGQDIPSLTTDNDTVTGSQTTYTATDIITDASSTDSDNLNVALTSDVTATPTVTGIEAVNYTLQAFQAGGDNTLSIDVANVGPTTISLDVDQIGSTVTAATLTNVATGQTVSTSADFTGTVTITAVDNAAVTVTGAAGTIVAASGGALTAANLSSSAAAGATFDTDSDGTATLTTTGTTGDMVVDAVAATTVVATSSGDIDADTNDLTAATSVTLTAGDDIDANIAAATTATLSAGSTTTDSDIDSATLTSVNLSGNGAAADFDLVGSASVATVNITGDQSVTVITSGAVVDGLTNNKLTVTDSSTAGTSTLQIGTGAGDMDLSSAAVDVINLAVNNNTKTMTVGTGQAVTISADQTGTSTIDGVDTSAATNTVAITLDDGVNDGNAADTAALVLTDFTSATIDASTDTTATGAASGSTIGTLTASADNTAVTINAGANGITLGNNAHSVGTGSLTINSTGAVAMGTGTLTSASFSSTGSGAVTWNGISGATNTSVTTGSGVDTLTLTATGDITINSAGGNDSVTIGAITTAGTDDIAINMGDGTADNLTITDGADLDTFATMSLTGMETITLTDAGGNGSAIAIAAATANGLSTVLLGPAAGQTDNLTITVATTDSTINLSGINVNTALMGADAGDTITVNGSANTNALTITGTNMKDTITGGAAADIIVGGAGNDALVGGGGGDTISSASGTNTITGGDGGDTMTGGTGADTFNMDGVNDLAGDVIDGGTGTDIISIGAGADAQHDLSTATVTNVETLTIATAADAIVLPQGTGIVTVNGLADDTGSSFTLLQGTTAFEAAAEATANAVDKAGEWFFAEGAADATLTYYDETLGAAKTITLVGVDAGDNQDDETIASAGGNLVVTVA